MSSYVCYPEYKPSNIEWLGDIPKHWDIWKVTHGFNRIGSGTTPKSDNTLFYGGNVPWVTTSELRETIIWDTSQKVTAEAVNVYSALKIYPAGSLAIAMYGATIGRLGVLGIDATFNQACCVYSEPTVFDTRFFYYWLWMRRPILISISNGGGQPNLSQDDLKKLWIPIPNKKEQQNIACFLDHKTAQIDALITKKESLLTKLAEKRTALISHAVTKGLDPTVPMKDSDVAWLGDVPNCWRIKRIKFSVKLVNEKLEVESSSLSYMGLEHIEPWTGKKIDGEINASEGLASRFISGDVLFGKLRPYLAKVHHAQHEGLISSEALVLRASYEVFSGYLKYYLLSKDFINIVDSSTYGTKMPRASWDFIGNLPILLPSHDEQEVIAHFLDDKISQLDIQMRRILSAIDKLKEYHAALITNAVTGKIDLRNFKVPKTFSEVA